MGRNWQLKFDEIFAFFIGAILSVRFIGLFACYTGHSKEKEVIQMEIRYVYGHVEVYTREGEFLFSADTEREAREELEEMTAA